MAGPIYVLGGYQTDFSANWARNGMELAYGIREVLAQGLDAVELEPRDLETVHVGNFAAELFCNQGHLGGLVAAAHPDLAGVPASRHEGACASGSLAALAASAELEAGRYGLAAVIGIAVIVVLITWVKLHPFLSLTIGALLTGVLAGMSVSGAVTSFTSVRT
jgi:acetyl-CoA C-acetyltransferase